MNPYEIAKINDNTWRIEDSMVRMFLLTGTEKALLIDTGMTRPDARTIAESLTTLPLMLLNTHADPDHISGNRAFPEAMMHPAEEQNYRMTGGTGPIVPVQAGDVIDLGDRPLEVIHMPGHTPGSIALLDKNARVLIAGDVIQDGRIFMFGPARDLNAYIESMKALKVRIADFDTVYPSHGTFPMEPARIDDLIGYAEMIRRGEAAGTPIEMFGRPVMLYVFEKAGFLGEVAK